MAKSPQKEISVFNKTVDAMSDDVVKIVRREIANGLSVDKAFAVALKELKYSKEIANALWSAMRSAMGSFSDSSTLLKRNIWLDRTWPDSEMSLSKKINDVSKMKDIRSSIKLSMRNADGWRSAASKLTDKDLTKADIPAYIKDIESASRKVFAGDQASFDEYRKVLADAKTKISSLAKSGAPTTHLKAAYEDLIAATESASEKAINKAMKNIVEKKARYNAERIARTETAKAASLATYADTQTDKDIIGFRYSLSSRHPERDICDFYTTANLYGLGKGCYPIDSLPPYPFHPHCLCGITKVYVGEKTPLNEEKAIEYLNNAPASARKTMLGAKGEKQFAANPKSWSQNLVWYGKPEPMSEKLAVLNTVAPEINEEKIAGI